jgi:hypothetical protein
MPVLHSFWENRKRLPTQRPEIKENTNHGKAKGVHEDSLLYGCPKLGAKTLAKRFFDCILAGRAGLTRARPARVQDC